MTSVTSSLLSRYWVRVGLFLLGLGILALVYIFQKWSPAAIFGISAPNTVFAVNRTIRLVINDLACFFIILAIFRERKYLKVAFYVFLIELFIILPGYLAIKLTLEGDTEISSPLLSHIHRLIVNPMLMILLIAGFFYQRFRASSSCN